MKKKIQISNCEFCFVSNKNMRIDEHLNNFIAREGQIADCTIEYEVQFIEEYDPLPAKILRELPGRMLVMTNEIGTLEYRLFFDFFTGDPNVFYQEMENGKTKINIRGKENDLLVIDEYFLEKIAMEKHLLECNCMILHSSSILVNGKAILFTAPSGTGKSTQAELWKTYRNAEILNGDRNILYFNKEGQWRVHGIPFCGTSGICKNVDVPLEAIVRLEQGKTDEILSRSPMEIVRDLYTESTVNVWNSQYVEKMLNMCSQLAKDVKQIRLSCTIGESAITCLEQELGMR